MLFSEASVIVPVLQQF